MGFHLEECGMNAPLLGSTKKGLELELSLLELDNQQSKRAPNQNHHLLSLPANPLLHNCTRSIIMDIATY
jgi:hypothetical protein